MGNRVRCLRGRRVGEEDQAVKATERTENVAPFEHGTAHAPSERKAARTESECVVIANRIAASGAPLVIAPTSGRFPSNAIRYRAKT